MRISVILALVLGLTGCEVVTMETGRPAGQRPVAEQQSAPTRGQARSFVEVARRMEPLAERICRNRTRGANCDFDIRVDTRAGQPPNAYQTLDRSGRPVIVFTSALIADTQNSDELAFVMGHEAAHHIEGHLGRTRDSAMAGAALGGILATVAGADVGTLQNLGASVGARRFSKDYELEADALGTIITARAGFDPLVGARYFTRIPDPGNRFLGTHPPNRDRIKTVRRTMAGMR